MYRAIYRAIAYLAIALLVCTPGHAADAATSDPGVAKGEFAEGFRCISLIPLREGLGMRVIGLLKFAR